MTFIPKWFTGTVEDRNDELKLGRVRIRVDVIHSQDKGLIPTSSLPWAMPIQPITSSAKDGIGVSPTGIIEGSRVVGFFADGDDCQIPFYIGTIAGNIGHLTYVAPDQAQNSTPTAASSNPKSSSKPPAKLGSTGPNKGADVAKRLQQRYGLTDFQAAGLVGNLSYESGGLVSNRIEGGKTGAPPAYGTCGVGYGWAQWTNGSVHRQVKPGSGRLDQFLNFASQNGLDPQSDEANFQFLTKELDNPKNNTIVNLKKTTTLHDATLSVEQTFENPANPESSLNQRISAANKALKGMSSVNVPVRTAGVANTAPAPDDQPKADIHPSEPPQTPYQGQYPYNKTERTESGHLIERDDTPGKERLLTYHRTGTYDEMRANGDRVQKIVGTGYTIIVHDDTISIEGAANLTVKGNINIVCYNDVSLNAAGKVNIKNAERMVLESDNDINLKAAGNLNLSAGGQLNLKASGDIAADGSNIWWNSGKSSDATGASGLKSLARQTPNSSTSLTVTESIANQYPDDPVALGKAYTAAGVANTDLVPVPLQSTDSYQAPIPKIVPFSKDTLGLQSLSSIVSGTKLSTNFTLGQILSTVTGVVSLVSNRNLSINQIASNLSLLTQNVIEPLMNQFPAMQIMSTFKPDDIPGMVSLHGTGQALTASFGDISSHFDVASWAARNLPTYQIILQGKWIHFSYKDGQQHPTSPLQTVANPAVMNPVFENGLLQYWDSSVASA